MVFTLQTIQIKTHCEKLSVSVFLSQNSFPYLKRLFVLLSRTSLKQSKDLPLLKLLLLTRFCRDLEKLGSKKQDQL